MKYMLFVIAACAALYGMLAWNSAQSVMQQSAALNLFTIAAVLAAGGAIVEAIEKLGAVTKLATARAGLASLNAKAAVAGPTAPAGFVRGGDGKLYRVGDDGYWYLADTASSPAAAAAPTSP